MAELFDLKNISPMLMAEESEPFDSADYLYELKLDGIRCVVYLDEHGTELRNKRNKVLNDLYPELAVIHKNVKQRCILDGELVVLTNGKPDFYALQRRSLMSNKMKIEQAARLKPVRFVAFDILYAGVRQVTDLPLIERKALLNQTVVESEDLAVSRYIIEKGVTFYHLAEQQELEGVVAKRMDSKYYFDKRTKDWIKFKKWKEADLIICGYVPDENGRIKTLSLGAYRDGILVNMGHVMFGVSAKEEQIIRKYAAKHPTPCPFGESKGDDVWFKPELVCTVRFMPNKLGSLRQPSFKGLREDKRADECVV